MCLSTILAKQHQYWNILGKLLCYRAFSPCRIGRVGELSVGRIREDTGNIPARAHEHVHLVASLPISRNHEVAEDALVLIKIPGVFVPRLKLAKRWCDKVEQRQDVVEGDFIGWRSLAIGRERAQCAECASIAAVTGWRRVL